MEFIPRAAELTTLLENRIMNYSTDLKVDEIGREKARAYQFQFASFFDLNPFLLTQPFSLNLPPTSSPEKKQEMRKLLFLTSTTLFSANAHLGHRVTFPHIKVYTCGSRNRIAILDSDKILICLRNALLFLGSIIRTKRGRFFLLNTQNVFIYEIMDEMANLIQDSQWKIGAFLKSPSKKNIRSRTNKISLGSHRFAPDCVLILDADRKSSVIVEADRSQIPIVSLVDSTTPLRSFQRITYPIPANNSIQFVYLFANLLTKKQQQKRNLSSSAKSKGKLKSEFLFFFFSLFMVLTTCVTFFFLSFYFPASLEIYKELAQTFIAWLCCLLSSTRSLFSELRGRRLAPLGMDPSGGSSVGEFDPNGKIVVQMDDSFWDNLDPLMEIPPAEVRERVNSLPSSSSLPTSLPSSSSLPTEGNSSQIPKHNIGVIGEDYGEEALERIDKKRKEMSIRRALPDYMAQFNNASPETIERELKFREKNIYQKHLFYFCFKKYDYKMPILDDVRGLVNKKEEEQKVHVLISQILEYQGRQPTLSEIWVLEKQLEHPLLRHDLLKHVFPEYVNELK